MNLASFHATNIKTSYGPGSNLGLCEIEILLDDAHENSCLLYTSDAADERSSVDLGGRRIIKKKKKKKENKQKKKKTRWRMTKQDTATLDTISRQSN